MENPEVEQNDDGPKVARIVSKTPREKTVNLSWPVEFDGKLYESVTIKRISGKEVRDYFELLADEDNEGDVIPPFLENIPQEVWDCLDDDDRFLIEEQSEDFMPRRLKALIQSAPGTSSDTPES
jgi:hypothetical protein